MGVDHRCAEILELGGKDLVPLSSALSEHRLPGRGPFRLPPPDVEDELRRTRGKEVLSEEDTVYLAEMDLTEVDFGGEELSEGILLKANLARARLDGASLRGAMAGGLILRGASCCGTDFFKASLEGADFVDAFGHFAYFCRADVSNAKFNEASLFHASFAGATCLATSFVRADLQGADLSDAILTKANLQEARLWGANFSGVSISSGTRLAGASGIDHVRAPILHFEGEKFEGDAAKELLAKLAGQSTDD